MDRTRTEQIIQAADSAARLSMLYSNRDGIAAYMLAKVGHLSFGQIALALEIDDPTDVMRAFNQVSARHLSRDHAMNKAVDLAGRLIAEAS